MASCCFPSSDHCVFCDVTTEKGFNIVYEDNDLIAFHDRAPGAKSHILIIPRKHVGTVKDLGRQHRDLCKQSFIVVLKPLMCKNLSFSQYFLG
ncbi:hypothetical protein INT43_002636 [Umbelopsis isabellina]|uniref:HIT domain-containing protein n=1 Tax=Mortierella isabellina TaxID=91625 RepID=A0A8H7Q5D8_MORIS|nr:hypothetical protein INT43_002636 [Umbelopsis isabellina]